MNDDMCMCMMQMTFSTSLPVSILFDNWTAKDAASYAWSWAVIFCMGFSRHLLSLLRYEVAAANWRPRKSGGARKTGALLTDEADDDGEKVGAVRPGGTAIRRYVVSSVLQRSHVLLRLVDVLLFGAVTTLGFLNMLVAMTYNPGLMMAVVAGEMAGVLTLENPGGLLPTVVGGNNGAGAAAVNTAGPSESGQDEVFENCCAGH